MYKRHRGARILQNQPAALDVCSQTYHVVSSRPREVLCMFFVFIKYKN